MRINDWPAQHRSQGACAPGRVRKMRIVRESGKLLMMIVITAMSVAAIMFVMHLIGFVPK
jgi:hypothetical protein